MHDLIQAFSKEDIMLCEIKVVDERGNDEMGVDLKGVHREAVSCFWQEFYNTCTIGERHTGKKAKYSYVFRALYGRNKLHIPTRIATPNMAGNITNIPWYYLSLYAMEYCGYSCGIYAWKYSRIRNV